MKYSQNKKRLCVRLDNVHIRKMKAYGLSVNRTINAALEMFVSDLDHRLVEPWRRDDVLVRNENIKHPHGTKSTQLRIEAMLFDRMEMMHYVKAKCIWHALERYFNYIDRHQVAQNRLDELKEKSERPTA